MSTMPESRFYMWRAVVAMAHADGIVSPHEINFLRAQMKDLPFSEDQLQTLAGDLALAQDIHVMFARVIHAQDKRDFFTLARVLSWSDGDYAAQEQHILDCLAADMQDEESHRLLDDSRRAVSEISLDADQWEKGVRETGFLGVLRRLAA